MITLHFCVLRDQVTDDGMSCTTSELTESYGA
jgi:hypothetical protein